VALAVRAVQAVRAATAAAPQPTEYPVTVAIVARAVREATAQAVEQVRRELMQAAVWAWWRLPDLTVATVVLPASAATREPPVALVALVVLPEPVHGVAPGEAPVQEQMEPAVAMD